MARQEKGTRVRTLPGRVQLRDKDAQANSYPTTVRFSTDERQGNQPIKFDDQNVIVFSEVDNFHPSLGLPSGSAWLSTTEASDTNSTAASAIIVPGRTNSGIVDGLQYVQFLSGVALKPFRDSEQDAADATSLSNNTFYTTGSAVLQVGEGFSTPLWSKQKIEVDIGVINDTGVYTYNANTAGNEAFGTSFPMLYYNFESGTWEGIGLGYEYNSLSDQADTIEHMQIGFINTFFPKGTSFVDIRSAGFMTSDFGFPYHPKFHATSSQTLSMDRYITQPFLLEKATIEITGSSEVGVLTLSLYDGMYKNTISASINTCFLLNQRSNASLNLIKYIGNIGAWNFAFLTASVPSWRRLNANSTEATLVTTTRDILGFSQIYSFASGAFDQLVYDTKSTTSSSARLELPIMENDIVITSSVAGDAGINWTGRVTLSMSMCSPLAGYISERNRYEASVSGAFSKTLIRYDGPGDFDEVLLGNDGYRTGLGLLRPSTRGLLSDYTRGKNLGQQAVVGSQSPPLQFSMFHARGKYKVNPYILLPTDKLVLGWQLPISTNPVQGIAANEFETVMAFWQGPCKLTLYGCYVSEGHEVNETTNQLLSSNSVHEVIGE